MTSRSPHTALWVGGAHSALGLPAGTLPANSVQSRRAHLLGVAPLGRVTRVRGAGRVAASSDPGEDHVVFAMGANLLSFRGPSFCFVSVPWLSKSDGGCCIRSLARSLATVAGVFLPVPRPRTGPVRASEPLGLARGFQAGHPAGPHQVSLWGCLHLRSPVLGCRLRNDAFRGALARSWRRAVTPPWPSAQRPARTLQGSRPRPRSPAPRYRRQGAFLPRGARLWNGLHSGGRPRREPDCPSGLGSLAGSASPQSGVP